VKLAQPFVDLTPTVVSRPVGALTAGGKARMSLNVQNKGNVTINQNVTIKVTLSTDNVGDAADPEVISITKRLSIRAGATKAVPITFTFPTTVAAGTYFLVATIDPANAIAETTVGGESNNILSSESFSIA
jgi:uncharacterized membrane protein